MYAITQAHEQIVLSILTKAGVCPSHQAPTDTPKAPVHWATALWDTGANHSCISDRLAAQLRLPEIDFVEIATASGIVEVPLYSVHLFLPGHPGFQDLEMTEFTFTNDDCDIIIGMDIMTKGDLSLTNQHGRTVFSFRIPSLHTVDFEVFE